MKKFNEHYKRRYPGLSVRALKGKLMGAAAMLLVAATLMATASYAWFVLSTAPELTGVDTQVGANGALEIALLDDASWENLDLLDMGDFDESAPNQASGNNVSWGNLVNLDDRKYGLQDITLLPARLNITHGGNDSQGNAQYKVMTNILKTPIYGEDGRLQGLDSTASVGYVYNNGKFSQNGYGVRAIGTCAGISVFQQGMNTAKSLLAENMAAAKNTASKAMSDNGAALADIVIAHALSGKDKDFSVENVKSIRALAVGMQKSLDNLETALRQVFAAYVSTEGATDITADNYENAISEINSASTTLESLQTKYANVSNMVPGINDYIIKLRQNQKDVTDAISKCDAKINSNATSDWNEIAAIVSPLVNTDKMTVGGKTIDEAKKAVIGPDGQVNVSEALKLINDGGVVIGVPHGSGLLANIADFAGDYAAKVNLENVKIKDYKFDTLTVTISVTGETPSYLSECSRGMRSATVATSSGTSNTMTDFYGYAIDLAFRTNAADSKLQLQTEPENRIYEGSTQNASLQGGGSYMSFATSSTISATKMIRLMSGVRVVFMDDQQAVLGIATLDCTLGKNLYAKLTEEIKKLYDLDYSGMAYYLNASTGGVQQSDLISEADYNKLPETAAVEYDTTTGELKAKLYLHSFEMTKSTNHSKEEIAANNGEDFYTGGITIGDKLSGKNDFITALTQNIAKKISTVVYIDGSVVNNSMVAANARYSMSGKLNLQFSSSANLMPMQDTTIQGGNAKYTQLAAAGEDYAYQGETYTVNEGYAICEKSTDPYNVYYHNVSDSAAESEENHTKLSKSNYSIALKIKQTP